MQRVTEFVLEQRCGADTRHVGCLAEAMEYSNRLRRLRSEPVNGRTHDQHNDHSKSKGGGGIANLSEVEGIKNEARPIP